MAFTQAHLPIRAALDAYKWPSDVVYEVFPRAPTRTTRTSAGIATSTWWCA